MSEMRRRLIMLERPYRRVEYLKSDSRAYINTGIVMDEDMVIKCEFLSEKYTKYGAIYGDYFPTDLNQLTLLTRLMLDSEKISINLNSNIDYGAVQVVEYSLNKRYSTTVSKNYTLINQNKYTYTLSKTYPANTGKLVLFNRGENAIYRDIGLRIYAFSIEKNGELLMELIPVRLGKTGYMFDNVTKKFFGNIGVGEFNIGKDL